MSAARRIAGSLLALGLLPGVVPAGNAGPTASGPPVAPRQAAAPAAPDGHEIMERMNRAFYYAGRDMRAKVVMELSDSTGATRRRVLSVLRLNLPAGEDQRYLVYFHEPGDVRRMTCMVWKHARRDDERWIFVPAVNAIRRILAPERSAFLGSDFVREEFSGRDTDADSHTLLREEKLEKRDCYVVESVPHRPREYSRFVSWIDEKTFLPIKQEFRNARGDVSRIFTALRIEEIPAQRAGGRTIPTVIERVMRNGISGHWTRVVYDSVAYDVGLKEADFSPGHMKQPLSSWLP